jgi:hypothetical protein
VGISQDSFEHLQVCVDITENRETHAAAVKRLQRYNGNASTI